MTDAGGTVSAATLPASRVSSFPRCNQRGSSGGDRAVSMWRAETGELQRTFQVEDRIAGQARAVAVSPDGRFVAAGFRTGAVLWELGTGFGYHNSEQKHNLFLLQTPLARCVD